MFNIGIIRGHEMFIEEIIPKVHLVPEAQPRDTNVPSGIIPVSQFKINIVSA